MEQILIRHLPPGTKALLTSRAKRNRRSTESEARDIISAALSQEPVTMVDLLRADATVEIDFEPDRLGLVARTPQL